MIHEDYPQLVIGARTIVRAALVENVTLAQLATAYGMTKRILVAKAQRYELLNSVKVQAAVFQAYLATLHEEAGYAELRLFLRAVFSQVLPPIVEACRSLPYTMNSMNGQAAADNHIGALGEWENTKRRYGRLVQYEKPRGVGPSHCPIWNVTCTVIFPEGGSREFEGSAETVAKAKNACVESLPTPFYLWTVSHVRFGLAARPGLHAGSSKSSLTSFGSAMTRKAMCGRGHAGWGSAEAKKGDWLYY
jgi:dsRNA-specific ribonuclease